MVILLEAGLFVSYLARVNIRDEFHSQYMADQFVAEY
jgi:hypothetical protein